MIRHIVMWNFADEISKDERMEISYKIKNDLEGMSNIADGVITIKVVINELASSNADIMLDSLFRDLDSLSAYQEHPEHKKIGAYVKSVVKDRKCIDYIEA